MRQRNHTQTDSFSTFSHPKDLNTLSAHVVLGNYPLHDPLHERTPAPWPRVPCRSTSGLPLHGQGSRGQKTCVNSLPTARCKSKDPRLGHAHSWRHISVVPLVRRDTTLDPSQKAKKATRKIVPYSVSRTFMRSTASCSLALDLFTEISHAFNDSSSTWWVSSRIWQRTPTRSDEPTRSNATVPGGT